MYFHKLLTRNEENWTRKMLHHLHDRNTGWAKSLIEKLTEYRLEPDWEKIKALTKNQWKEVVKNAINERNKQKLITNCTTTTPQETKVNTKSKYIYNILTTTTYERSPLKEILNQEKQKTKTIILARSGMLECGRNFKGTMKEMCTECNENDDEDHRLNNCKKWELTNNVGKDKIDFQDIYSSDPQVLNQIIKAIENVWELKYANGRMKR